MNLAIGAYISRVNHCKCGSSEIHFYSGTVSEEKQYERTKLLIYLKGSKTAKKALELEEPSLYGHFKFVSTIIKNHMVPGLPSYMYYLLCCFKDDCRHPRCKAGKPKEPARWYPDGPPLTCIPLPVTKIPWGSSGCPHCKLSCCGHYATKLFDVTDPEILSKVPKPPSAQLKQLFSQAKNIVTDELVKKAAQEVLLPTEECRIWLIHLKTVMENRLKGAKKAAQTRRSKRQKSTTTTTDPAISKLPSSENNVQNWFCGKCGEEFHEETVEEESWIECSLCLVWYHFECEQIVTPPDVDYICLKCKQ